jgi:hypothetical protein
MNFRIGYDFRRGMQKVPHKDGSSEKRKETIGKHTAELFLFALEESGCGPPKGIMNLATDGGSAAFLREVKNHLSVENTFVNVKSVREYANENEVPEDIAGGIPGNVVVDKALEYEGDIPISKVSVSPLLLFLHVDQGSFANLGYTPFATLRVNSRSIHKQHVEEAIAEVKDGKPIISQEDIAVTPFEVCLGDSNQEETGSLTYNCTLNRDSQSEVAVMGKRAAVATHEAIDNLYQKVNCTSLYSRTPPRLGRSKQAWLILFCVLFHRSWERTYYQVIRTSPEQ